jgi:hypothetical protein
MGVAVVDKEVDSIIVAVEAVVLVVMQVDESHFSNNNNNYSMMNNRIQTWGKTMGREAVMLVPSLVVVVTNSLAAPVGLDCLTRRCCVQCRES